MPPKKTKKPPGKQDAAKVANPRWSECGDGPPDWAVAIVLALSIGLVYSRALRAPFIFDDAVSIVGNGSITSLWPLTGSAEHPGPLNPPPDIPTSARPLVNLSFALNYCVGGLRPEGYHIVNVALHYLSSLFAWAVVRRTLRLAYFAGRFETSAGSIAAGAALLWALHPLQTEAVVYVTQRTELMVAVFYFATLYCSLRYWAAKNRGVSRAFWLMLVVIACSAGMGSKEVMASAPLMVFLFERTFVAGSMKAALQNSWPLYAGLMATWLVLLALSLGAPHGISAGFGRGVPAYDWWLTQAKVLMIYLKLVVWPFPLVVHYQFPYLKSFTEAWVYVIPTLLLGIVVLLFLCRNHPIGFLGTWVFAILAPTSVVPIVTEMAAERRMYLPLVALVVLLVVGGYLLAQSAGKRWNVAGARGDGISVPRFAIISVTLAIASLYCLVDVRRLSAYDDEMQLLQDVLRHQPQNFMAHNNLGGLLIKKGRFSEAIDALHSTLKLRPDYPAALNNLGIALISSGRFSEAVEHLEYAVKLKPDYADAHNNLGWALMNVGRFSESIQHLNECLRLQPNNAEAHDNLGVVLVKNNQIPEAIEHFRQATLLNPSLVNAHVHLGNILRVTGNDREASDQLAQGLQLQPERSDVHVSLGDILAKSGHTKEAIEHYRAALRIDPNFAQALANLAKALAVMDRSEEAIATAQRGIEAARNAGQDVIAEQIEDWLSHYRAELKRAAAPSQ